MKAQALYAVLDFRGIVRGSLKEVRRELLDDAKTLDLNGEREALHAVRLALCAVDDALAAISGEPLH